VTLVTFANAESQRAWRAHPDHRLAQQAGRDRFYAEYSIQVCECTRVSTFEAPEDHAQMAATSPSSAGSSGRSGKLRA
jgi:uncharacterized protein with NRDE domain